MKVIKYFSLKINIVLDKIAGLTYKYKGKILRFSPLILGISIPLFMSEGSAFNISEHPFLSIDNKKVIGMDLGTQKLTITTNKETEASLTVVEDNFCRKYTESLIVSQTRDKIFASRKNGFAAKGLGSYMLLKSLINNPCTFKPVAGYEGYLDEYEYKKKSTMIIPIQNMFFPLSNNPEYNKKQIFGIALQAIQCFVKEYSANKNMLSTEGGKVFLTLTFSDLVPEENQRLIAAIYAQTYANEFCGGDLSRVEVSYIRESDATIVAYLYENYPKLINEPNNYKLVVLNLGQSGIMMKGLVVEGYKIKVTESCFSDNISGDLIDQVIWDNAMETSIANAMVASEDMNISSDEVDNLLKTNIYLKNKCLVEQKQAKEKLSAQGADTIQLNISNLYNNEDLVVEFSVDNLNKALNNAGLIETFKNDIQDGVKKMFGEVDIKKDKETGKKNVEFVIVGGSLRIPCLKKAVTELVIGEEIKDKANIEAAISANLIQTLNMDEAPAYGASYVSLLNPSYKNNFSKKIDTATIKSILGSIDFYNTYEPVINRLFDEYEHSENSAHIRNEIEATCYAIDHIIIEIEETNLSKLEKQIKKLEEDLQDPRKSEDKDEMQKESCNLILLKQCVENKEEWKNIQLCSNRILYIIKSKNNLNSNLDFLTTLSNDFNKDIINKCQENPTILSERIQTIDRIISLPDFISPTSRYVVESYEKTNLNLLSDNNIRYLLNKLHDDNPDFTSYDVFETLLHEHEKVDPLVAVDIWLYVKLYFLSQENTPTPNSTF